jgi:hypothetical protein
MKYTKPTYPFAAGILTALLGGAGIFGFLLSGCFPPVMADPPGGGGGRAGTDPRAKLDPRESGAAFFMRGGHEE